MERNNCLICGSALEYQRTQTEMECVICKGKFMSNVQCRKGHYICDDCHRAEGIAAIRQNAMETKEKNPFLILETIMDSPYIHMHGPEHHIAVGASLLAAYHNCGGKLDLEKEIEEMIQRGSQLPGGICGFWGCCGAAVSGGIFFSIITEATPMGSENWGAAQKATADALTKIGQAGGPRCCKRDSFLSIASMVELADHHLGIKMEGRPEDVTCKFFIKNSECIKENCLFYPK